MEKLPFPEKGQTACYNCRYYIRTLQILEDKQEVELRQGYCRRLPPMVFPIPGDASGGYNSAFPSVSCGAWCGEFVAKEEEPKNEESSN